MKNKTSKAQTEVWEWKEIAAKDIVNLPVKEVINYVGKNVSEMKSFIFRHKSKEYPDIIEDINFVAEK